MLPETPDEASVVPWANVSTAADPSSQRGGGVSARADELFLVVRGHGTARVVGVADGDIVTIGRSPSATLSIDDERASRDHARIERRGSIVVVRDLGSRNGTWINDEKLTGEERSLVAGDAIRVGALSMVVAAAATQPARAHAHSTALSASLAADEIPSFIVADPVMVRVFEIVRRLAEKTTTVLILGETGVGKEVVAEQLHRWGPRASKPFVRINCAALPEALADAELFGHEKGAFTGADRRRVGYIEAAHEGTLMLDEIGELPLPLQAKLLRVLEARRLVRVGSTQEIPIDVRIIAATCRDLEAAIESGRFRQDLYYRVSAFCLEVPPLRERPAEIALLAELFARQLSDASDATLSPDALETLTHYAWPGNVRELRNAIEHALVLATSRTLTTNDLPRNVRDKAPVAPVGASDDARMPARVAETERRTINDALVACAGNRTQAAMRLGISRRQLVYKLAKHKIR